MVKILVTGASGLLGRAVLAAAKAAGHQVTGTAFTRAGEGLVQIDLQDEAALEALLSKLAPDVVIHCAAERRPDVAEANPSAVHELNVSLPTTLSALSRSPAHPFSLIYISTDYVFDGSAPEGGYTPADAVGPTNLYGRTKELGERAVVAGIKAGGRGTALRVPVLYGPVQTNSESAINILLDLTRAAASGEKEVKMDDWAIRYPTNVLDVARVLVDLAVHPGPLPPIVHFSTQAPYTKYAICHLLASLHSPPLDISSMVPVPDGPKAGETIRPKDCHLSNSELEKLGIATGGIEFGQWWSEWLAEEGKQV